MSGFRHVVLFKWAEGTSEAQVAKLMDRLSRLPAEIPQLRGYQFGPNAGVNPANADFAVVADFAAASDYEIYRDHPEHQALIRECVTPIVASRTALQYVI